MDDGLENELEIIRQQANQKMEAALKEQLDVYDSTLVETQEKIKKLKESGWHTETIRKYIAELNNEIKDLV